MNSRGIPDTIPIDPLGKYDLVVHTVPPVSKKGVELTAGTHNVIAVDAPQGDLELKMNGFNEYEDLKAIVRQQGKKETMLVQDFNHIQRYIIGKYDLEILTLPRTYISDVNIAQSHTTTVEIPQAGIATIGMTSKGYGSIFEMKEDKLIWVCDLSEQTTRQSIVLQPGTYHVIYRSANAKQSIYTKEETFTVQSGQSTQIKL